MSQLELTVLSLRYSSWSMRAWLALTHAGAAFTKHTVALPHMHEQGETTLADRRALGSVHGLFPVLSVDGTPIHESLAICEYAAETYPEAGLWPAGALERAQARAISCEMASGFAHMRNSLSCHLFGRVPEFAPSAGALADCARVFEIWSESLDRSGGPFLFGRFGIADVMYFPVLTRFRTYAIPIPDSVAAYTRAIDTSPAVQALLEVARHEPRIPIYDEHMRTLGGDPDAALH